ncbi:hypothetical protein GUITHDRAFT_131448 [Guillardia theta CCMP2712]|uniref:Uncharacterized protein n=1 Tax=Guillardia theta (strain CCMP2712) TaxID=905079 RepID=L1K495_GUITC|nr:hypothetical protein GUITHDRAFT_131448 [Guillardia theta CCMP2712]EKX55188.1 hypothetical protein GUITHDRAFT_131448 [Guillardia theta CCMP2712]|mmetsp:Transcript_36426/g.113499  ORF Transcript_36426/g.113499 Transcript_36426/m.113499 type:complete len:291 (-) Transcript_36426:216-1088(-)|eukprot:XP_005842168.1 hypothetical protein GUITHDRAFT_131448 [Guillardia theta CCMP2712]
MDRLPRKKASDVFVDEHIEAHTSDNEDHTFAGIMFNVSVANLPFEAVQISSVWIRGGLGPISIWSTPEGFEDKREKQEEWENHYSKQHRASLYQFKEMKLKKPILLSAGETRGIYIHSACEGDEQIVYDDKRGRQTYSDFCLKIRPGYAHLSHVPFSAEHTNWGGWGPAWRDNRAFVGKLDYGIKWLRWNPEVHVQLPSFFRKIVWCLLMSQHARASCSFLHVLEENSLFYIINSVNWWEMAGSKKALRRKKVVREEAEELAGKKSKKRSRMSWPGLNYYVDDVAEGDEL